MIAEVVAEQRMPPWYASRRHQFSNERGLSAAERRQIAAWVQGGMPEGDPPQAPPATDVSSTSKWEIGEPDLVTRRSKRTRLPARRRSSTIAYVVLALCLYGRHLDHRRRDSARQSPHRAPLQHGALHAGQEVFGREFHHRPRAGRHAADRRRGDGLADSKRLGRRVADSLHDHRETRKEPHVGRFQVPERVVHKEIQALAGDNVEFCHPPGSSAHPIVSSRTLPGDASGIGMFSHMHLRGKDMTFIAHTPRRRTAKRC